MDEVYGGRLDEAGAAERGVDGGVLAALSGRDGADPLAGAPGLIVAAPDGDGVALLPAIASRPLHLATGRAAGPALLARVGRALAALHAAGRWHGDLRPGTVRVGPDGAPLLVTPARPVDAGRLLAARLRAGAPPVAVAHAAPEVVAGGAGGASADVYALAALAYQLVAGRPALGALELPPGALGLALGRALSADPARRGGIDALAAALEGAPEAAPEPALTAGAAPTGPVVEPAWDDAPPSKEAVAQRAGGVSVILALVLALGGVFVVAGAVFLVALGWDTLGPVGQCGLLFLLTAGLLGTGLWAESRGYVRTGFAFLAIGTQLLWADGLFVLAQLEPSEPEGPGLAVAAFVTGVTWTFAATRRSAVLGTLAALDAIAAWALLGELLSSGGDTGPPLFLLLVAAGYAALAWAADRLGGTRPAVPLALLALGACGLSGLWGYPLITDYQESDRLFGSVWPYVAFAAAAGAARATTGAYRVLALIPAVLLALLTPTVSALCGWEHLAYLQLSVLVGGAALGAAFFLPAVSGQDGRQLLAALYGVAQAATPTAILALVHCAGRGGRELLEDALARPGALLDGRFVWLSAALGVSTGLVAAGVLLGSRARRPLAYRLVELAGITLFFFVLTILSLAESDDVVYPLLLLAGGTALLVVGVTRERLMLVAGAVIGLTINAWVQYFARLHGVLPTPLLMIGFGLSILAAGVLYERKVKGLLAGLKGWA